MIKQDSGKKLLNLLKEQRKFFIRTANQKQNYME